MSNEQVRANCAALHAAGHAVVLSEVVEADGSTNYMCHHYLTCVQCRKDRQAKHPAPQGQALPTVQREQVIGTVKVMRSSLTGQVLLDFDAQRCPLEEARVDFADGTVLDVILRPTEQTTEAEYVATRASESA